MNKSIKTRIQNKHDLEVNWLQASFIPLPGELIVYDIEVDSTGNTLTKVVDGQQVLLLPAGRTEPFTYERVKIGDGIHTVNELPFIVDGVDLSEYAKKNDIPDVSAFITEIPAEYVKESELESKGYATETFVSAEIAKAKLEGDDVDLSGYATKDDIKNFITEIPAEYITESELTAKGYLTEHQNISHLATKESIPTKVSQLTNDKNYLTDIPDEYVTDAELTAKGYLTEHQSLADYAKKTDLPVVPTNVCWLLDTASRY